MDARDAFRKSQLLEECQVAPEIFEQVIPRLYTFMQPFVKVFQIPPDLVVKFQRIDFVEVILWGVLRLHVVHQREIKG